ncbi:MAG: hypothetical protein WCK35_15600, partial [Chloroflexota bacterium]
VYPTFPYLGIHEFLKRYVISISLTRNCQKVSFWQFLVKEVNLLPEHRQNSGRLGLHLPTYLIRIGNELIYASGSLAHKYIPDK